MSQGRQASSDVRMTVEDAAAIVGVLRIAEPSMPSDVRPLTTRVIARVERCLESADNPPENPFASLTTMEAEALRLSELVSTYIAELAGVVSLLETVTTRDDLPFVMTALS